MKLLYPYIENYHRVHPKQEINLGCRFEVDEGASSCLKQMQAGRLVWVDVAKGIGILAVIAGHMGVPWLNRLIYPWHMPLFFVLSGYFLSDRCTVGLFVRLKAKSLLLPFLYTAIALVGAEFLWGVWHSGLGVAAVKCAVMTALKAAVGSGSEEFLGIGAIGAIWFFEALFIALVWNRILCSVRLGWLVIVFFALLSVWSAKFVWLPLNIQSGLLSAFFVYIGMVSKRLDMLRYKSLLCFIGFCCLLCSFFLKPPTLCIVKCSGNPIFYFLSLFIVYLMCCLSIAVTQFAVLAKTLSFLGRNSCAVLCLHLFELNEIPWGLLLAKIGLSSVVGRVLFVYALKLMFVLVCLSAILSIKWNRGQGR